MAGPFHYNVWRDTERQAIDDECSTASMSSHQLPLLLHLIFSLVSFIGGDADLLIDSSQPAQLLQLPVHGLVLDNGKHLVSGELEVLVLFENTTSDAVQLNGNAISCLHRGNLDVVALDVVFPEVIDIGMTQA